MKFFQTRILSTLVGCAAVLLGASPAMADDSEVFTSAAFAAGSIVRPNVLFVIDSSGSMNDEVITYDSTVTYAGSGTICDKNRIYWQTADGSKPPSCAATTWINMSDNKCRSAYQGMVDNGWWRGRAAQLNSSATTWQDIVDDRRGRLVECQLDSGTHGNADPAGADGGTKKYARNGTGTDRWGASSTSGSNVDWRNDINNVSFYSGNYVNWYNTKDSAGTKAGSKIETRLQIVKKVANDLIGKLNGVNLGIMRYSNNEGGDYETTAEGGMVLHPVSELTDPMRTTMQAKVTAIVGAGNTPLSETLYEAMLYMSGGNVDYGNKSKLDKDTNFHSVKESRVGGTATGTQYDSPMDFTCQNNYIVYLTDGLPTADNSADNKIEALTGTTCPAEGPDGTTRGRCMVDLAKYMHENDFKTMAGVQSVTTYVIGFGSDIETSKQFLIDVAEAGGGEAFTQNDAAGLTSTLEKIFTDVAESSNSTFVSPTVAVNAFNRTRNLDTLFVSVFAPSKKLHWPGNVKKYRLVDGQIRGAGMSSGSAVDPDTGFFADGVKDFFSADTAADGAQVTLGGAASRITSASRKIYTYMGTANPLTDASNVISTTNAAAIAVAMPGTPTTTEIQDFVDFIKGKDSYDEDKKPATTERKTIGDPMRTRPAVGIYGGTETAPTGLVYTTTNDGFLHAFDMVTGSEEWAFIPREFLTRQWDLKTNALTGGHRYAIDGDVRLFKFDFDNNGKIDHIKDKMWAVFGFGRGGAVYYALDVTSRTTPKFMWKKTTSSTGMAALGQAWSAPVITRVNVDSGLQTDPQKFVAIFGGGYDTAQENYTYTADSKGNGIYMLELSTGNLLWSAGPDTSATANFTSKAMNNSIPSEITVLDLDGDGYSDRMYTGDMGGRIWRFDIWHGQKPDKLVSGGLFATLGVGHLTVPDADKPIEDTRRFYYAPDVAVVTPRGSAPYFNIAIGSGYRGHPLETDVHDSFFSLRDYQPFNRRTTASYDTPWKPITVTDLVNVTENVATAVVDGSNGWVLDLNVNDWRGEKVLAESVTANGVIFFPTFTPRGADDENPCLPKTLNRTYAVYMDSAKPFGLRDGAKPGDPPETGDPEDRFIDLEQGGIAPGLAVIQTPDNKTLCLEGVEALGRCVDIGDVVRTFWERRQ